MRLFIHAVFILMALFCTTPGQSATFCRDLIPDSAESIKKSPNYDKFLALLQKGSAAALDDFMILWNPEKAVTENPSPLVDPKLGVDTVYSWGSANKILRMKKSLPDGQKWDGPSAEAPSGQLVAPGFGGSIYVAFSAVASFGYGVIPVRIKLKKMTPPSELPLYDGPDALQQSYIFDSSLIESWSYGTPEHYDEIIRDYKRYKSGRTWYGLKIGDDLFATNWDGNIFSQEILKDNLIKMIDQIVKSEGEIIYSQEGIRNRENHFSTLHHTYINP